MSNNQNTKCDDNTNMLERAARAITEALTLNGTNYFKEENANHNCIATPKTPEAADKKAASQKI